MTFGSAGIDDTAFAELDRLANRLRGLSPREWGQSGRADAVRAAVAELAALTAPDRRLPAVPDHALGDVLAVVGADALGSPAGTDDVRRLVRAALDATR